LLEERKRGLTDPVIAAQILADIPAEPLDTQRKMLYFLEPRWRRLTEYEMLTVYAQPTPDWIPGGLDWGDWTQKFHGGRPSWGNETTELKTTDWHRHRDPARRWHPVYVKAKSEEWLYTTRFLEGFSAEGQLRTMDPFWRDTVISTYLGAYGFNEYGLFNAHSSVLRDCLSDTLRNTFGMAGFDKIDNAQMIQLIRSFMAKTIPGYSDSTAAAKQEWTQGAIFKSARETVQDIWQVTYDWNEIMWATHMVFDPLFGQLVRREFFQTLAPLFGDALTPFIVGQMQTYFQNTRAAMEDIYFECLANDAEFSGYNRRWLRAWTDKWLPRTLAAMTDFMAIYAKVPRVARFTDGQSIAAGVERVVNDWVQDYASKIDYQVDPRKLIGTVIAGIQ